MKIKSECPILAFINKILKKIYSKGKLSGIDFHYIFEFTLLDSFLIRDHVLMPLLFNCFEYQTRETDFIKTIVNKDKEIDDYRTQGIKLSRSNHVYFYTVKL